MKSSNQWYIYILQCSDKTYYTGITTDVQRRLHEHNHARTAAKYTRARRPVELVYQESSCDRSSATKRELEIKKLSAEQKLLLIRSQNHQP